MSKEYIKPSDFDKKGTPMKYHNQMDKKRRAVGASTKMRPETVIIKDTKTGKVYGRRTIVTKTTEGEQMSFLKSLITMIIETDEITLLPASVLGELKKLIRKGASDLEQKWENALELVNKAYQVASVRRPAADQTGAWKQYEDMISFGVKELSKNRGLDGKWRTTGSVLREQAMNRTETPLPKKRFFVDVPNAASFEADITSLDEIIEKLQNLLRIKGIKVRVAERAKKHAVLSFLDNDAERDRITVKEIS